MKYTQVNIESWHRQEHYNFYRQIQCNFSLTTDIDVTNVVALYKRNNYKFYPVMIYLLTKAVNSSSAFKMAMKEGELIEWDEVVPTYTIFNPDTETFSSLWTEYDEDLHTFILYYQEDFELYQHHVGLSAKPNLPENHFNISSLPWTTFSGFNLSFPEVKDYFAPIFTMGKFYEKDGKILLPLAIQVHHAVCDGFHVGKLIETLQNLCLEAQ